MALSRIALALAFALVSAPAAAQPDAVEAQREAVRSVVADDCGSAAGEEIVVCGRREQERQARRFRVEPSPPGAERAGGAQLDAMAAGDTRCSTVGPVQQCTRGLDVIGIGATILRGIQAIRERRD